jgi:hypothetical protein
VSFLFGYSCPSFKQVICRDDAIVCPHLQSKIQKSGSRRLERKHGFLLATPVAKSGSCRLECKRCFLLATPVAKFQESFEDRG